jgi:F-type H+-transporting ATPase subunit c
LRRGESFAENRELNLKKLFTRRQREGVCKVRRQPPTSGKLIKENTMRKLSYLFMSLSALCFATPAFAQGGAAGETNWIAITAGFSMAIASAVCGLAQGKAVAAATESLARNPAARPGIQFSLILGLVLIESLALYTLAIIFLKVK